MEEEARKAGVWFSKGTFGRPRDAAGVRTVLAGELERLLGNEEALFVSDHKGWVAAIVQQEEPPLYLPPDDPALRPTPGAARSGEVVVSALAPIWPEQRPSRIVWKAVCSCR